MKDEQIGKVQDPQ